MRLSPWFPLIAAPLIVTGCAHTPPAAYIAPVVAAPARRPMPPLNAAATLTLPPQRADGSFQTPNRDLSGTATLWNVRSALNVAALQCEAGYPAIVDDYNRFLTGHRQLLATTHLALSKSYQDRSGPTGQDEFDRTMTRVYNYFAQPPAQSGFCAVAAPMITELSAMPDADLANAAPAALARLDTPFTDFYAAYSRYKRDLASWEAGRQPSAPRLTVDPSVLMASEEVTGGGRIRVAAK